jgi:hypothetical protein
MNLSDVKKGLFHPEIAANFLSNRHGNKILRRTFDDSGIRILERDWDTLIILDCARYDIFAESIGAAGSLSKERSAAAVTSNFIRRNFSERKAHDLVYLSANPVVGAQEEYLDIFKLVGAWKEDNSQKRGQENPNAITDPDPVIEMTEELHETYPHKRHIVHLLPPHVPHRFRGGKELSGNSPYRNYQAARNGDVSEQEMREVYVENLQAVLQKTLALADNLGGKIVITADHGELLGKGIPLWMKTLHGRWRWGDWAKYDYGHYMNVDVPQLVEVPWFELPVEQRRRIKAEPPSSDQFDTGDIEEKLETLGYRT